MTAEKTAEKAKETKKKTAAPKTGQKRTITIRLLKGRAGCNPDQRATLCGLGLKKREQEKTLENTPSVRGMIKKVLHMVQVVSETR